MFSIRYLRGKCCERFRAEWSATSRPTSASRALFPHSRTASSDWRACLDPAADQVEVRAIYLGMGLNAEVYAEVGNALGAPFAAAEDEDWAQATA